MFRGRIAQKGSPANRPGTCHVFALQYIEKMQKNNCSFDDR
jgi:hypothetical protein